MVPHLMAIVFSGIKPSGEVQLGNYIGALRHWAAGQDSYEGYFCLVDMHAITVPQDPAEVRGWTRELAAILIAVGIDPDRSTLFVQSHVHEHAELGWVLNCFTTFGELRRMTQFKEKAQAQTEGSVTVGLFDYPVLQAADILLYRTTHVPIGEDQRQHVELTRDIAGRFNGRFGETFVLPEPMVPPTGARIMDLQNPTAKMSKSAESPHGTLTILDAPDEIRRKVRTAVTDSGRDIVASPDKPAITNLLTIYSVVGGKEIPTLQAEYAGKGYADLKSDLAEALVEFLAPVQERYRAIAGNPEELDRILETGAQKAQKVASEMLELVYERVGFIPRRG
jgi:tryptophanyl-tRNA synthetase